jgi:hypothetical protein
MDDNTALLARIDERTKLTGEKIDRLEGMLTDYGSRVNAVEIAQATTNERLSSSQRWQAIFTAIASVIAGAFGSTR